MMRKNTGLNIVRVQDTEFSGADDPKLLEQENHNGANDNTSFRRFA